MTIKLNNILVQQRLGVISDAVNAGGAAGKVIIYGGVRPVVPGTSPVGTPLATVTLAFPAFDPVTGSNLVAKPISPALATGTGTATWFRMSASNGAFVLDGDVGQINSDMIMPTSEIVAGITLNVSSLVIVDGN